MSVAENVFWDDLAEDLDNPEFRHHYILESERIAAIDAIINQLDEVRTGQADCEMDEKVALLKKVAELVGVDMSDVFGSE